jgi:hypothetical protein
MCVYVCMCVLVCVSSLSTVCVIVCLQSKSAYLHRASRFKSEVCLTHVVPTVEEAEFMVKLRSKAKAAAFKRFINIKSMEKEVAAGEAINNNIGAVAVGAAGGDGDDAGGNEGGGGGGGGRGRRSSGGREEEEGGDAGTGVTAPSFFFCFFLRFLSCPSRCCLLLLF